MTADPTIVAAPCPPDERLTSAWREHLDVRLAELSVRAAQLPAGSDHDLALELLERARSAVHRTWGARAPLAAWIGTDVERAWVSTHAAEVVMLRGVEADKVRDLLPTVIAECDVALPGDARVTALKAVASEGKRVTEAQRAQAADLLEAGYAASDAQHVQVRSFRNILLATTGVLLLVAVLIGVWGALGPHALALCSTSTAKDTATCPAGAHRPTSPDVFLVEAFGLIGASITAAFAIRNLQGTATPYGVPLASLALKLPIGALTAFGGLLLLRAGFGPANSTIGQAQAAAYALLFGASQQLFMQFVDKQAKVVLDSVPSPKKG